MPGLDWLTARPVAHRGLHNLGVVENTASAFAAAIASNYAIECDLQVTADGEAMVYHDDTLGRLTAGEGRLDAMSAAQLKQVPFRATTDRMLTLGELCDLVDGRVALIIELKSRFDGDMRLAIRAADIVSRYRGRAALMSFDPAPIAEIRRLAPTLPRGIVAERRRRGAHDQFSGRFRGGMAYARHALASRPQFVAYSVSDLPSIVPWLARRVLRLPLLAWTVRTEVDRARAARYADQMIFEGIRP
jgi:glycerophosphoryl diester phosphodiesterase